MNQVSYLLKTCNPYPDLWLMIPTIFMTKVEARGREGRKEEGNENGNGNGNGNGKRRNEIKGVKKG